ncbi:MAG: c-type cytochrome, partial [Myxococcota bacterium]
APAPAAAEPAAAPAPDAAVATATAGTEGAAAATPGAAEEAASIFKTRCVICHGESGKGDGATAAALNPKPRDYTDAAWQASVTDEQLAKAIVEGGAAVGKSALMPANPDLAGKPEVVAEIVKIIRGFAPKN